MQYNKVSFDKFVPNDNDSYILNTLRREIITPSKLYNNGFVSSPIFFLYLLSNALIIGLLYTNSVIESLSCKSRYSSYICSLLKLGITAPYLLKVSIGLLPKISLFSC